MAKKTAAESDESRLKTKVAAKLKGHENPEGDAALRALKKRLKRTQRKRRSLAQRMKRAAGEQAAAPAAS